MEAMNKYINRYGILAVIITAVCFIMSSCGGDDEPTPKPIPVPNPTPTVNVQEIIESAITMNAEEMKLYVAVAEQEGGRAVLSGTVAETKASSKVNIDGIYDTKKSCYVFDLSGIDVGSTYRYRVAVYNASGQKVMESKELTAVIPESANVDKDGTEGGSEGMRGGTYVYNN